MGCAGEVWSSSGEVWELSCPPGMATGSEDALTGGSACPPVLEPFPWNPRLVWVARTLKRYLCPAQMPSSCPGVQPRGAWQLGFNAKSHLSERVTPSLSSKKSLEWSENGALLFVCVWLCLPGCISSGNGLENKANKRGNNK